MRWIKDRLAGREPHITTVGILYMYIGAWVPNKSRNGAGDSHIAPTYWEGAVDLNGIRFGIAIARLGYLEMTGYSKGGSAKSFL
jgi:hypothetical protein